MLSQQQRLIVDLLEIGYTVEEICSALNKPERIIKAQITRIEGKVGKIPINKVDNTPDNESVDYIEPTDCNPQNVDCNSQNNEPVTDDLDLSASADEFNRNIDKLSELGTKALPTYITAITVEFVKICGGRLNAHKIIEDVYQALVTICDSKGISSVDDESE